MSLTKSLALPKKIFYPFALSNSSNWSLGSSFCKKPVRAWNKVIRFCSHSNMEGDVFQPPENIRGMKVLDRDACRKTINVCSVEVEQVHLIKLQKGLHKYILRGINLKCVRDTDKENYKRLLFNPNLVRCYNDFDAKSQQLLKTLDLNDKLTVVNVDLTYENWKAASLLKAILPQEYDPLTSFSVIGHIIHVNLKPVLLEYKSIIGQILLDKTNNIKTVVNKVEKIDNVYRNFEMELICGVPEYLVTIKENHCTYKFDFSKVYWNTRLNSEHRRIAESLGLQSVLFDVFCGVGPFAIPAAKRKCLVHANDLNPECVKWLNENIKVNKIKGEYIQVYNKDGADFIKDDIKSNLIKLWKDAAFFQKIVIVMNLPGLGLDFLKCFKGLMKSEINNLDSAVVSKYLPIVYCYFFSSKFLNQDELKALIEEKSLVDLSSAEHSIDYVRNVSVTRNMYKLKIVLQYTYLFSDEGSLVSNSDEASLKEPVAKKLKSDCVL